MPKQTKPFPNLKQINKTSEQTDCYNCIAWAFEDNTQFWWPEDHPKSYWPLDFNGRTVHEAFMELFEMYGWTETDNRVHEDGYKKIALYYKNGHPTHAARLLNSGYWTSKLGRSIDISHTENCLDGPTYGQIEKVFKKEI